MKEIKKKIIEKSIEMFNLHGVADVSIREIAREIGISHSNLIYHFKDKNCLIDEIHQSLFNQAIELNQEINLINCPLKKLFVSTTKGFKVIENFKFFMLDFNYILKNNSKLHSTIKDIEEIRYQMYKVLIEENISKKIFRSSDFNMEYELLIKQIRIFSDYWLASAQIYEKTVSNSHIKYASLFLNQFYPYLTVSGKKLFSIYMNEFQLPLES
ncbi:MAG TPA: TetR/AcrR family transcriptional regulator [Fluviicola sp.]|nr:TetR/AcrR family transcriptional regulator [Fluviicola sp.]